MKIHELLIHSLSESSVLLNERAYTRSLKETSFGYDINDLREELDIKEDQFLVFYSWYLGPLAAREEVFVIDRDGNVIKSKLLSIS